RTAASARVGAALLAAALTAPTLVGCSSGNGPGPASADASGPLRVWARGANDSPRAYQAIFDAFTKKTGIKIEPFFTLTDFETKLTAAATAHNLPDVVVDDAAQLGNFKTQGIIQPVDKSKIASADQLTPASWDSAKDLKGDIYAVPFSAQANLLFIRSDWLAKLNLQAPKTWDDVVQDTVLWPGGGPGQRARRHHHRDEQGVPDRGHRDVLHRPVRVRDDGRHGGQGQVHGGRPARGTGQRQDAGGGYEHLPDVRRQVQRREEARRVHDHTRGAEAGHDGRTLGHDRPAAGQLDRRRGHRAQERRAVDAGPAGVPEQRALRAGQHAQLDGAAAGDLRRA